MKNLKLGICFLDEEDNIINKRTVGSNWEVYIEEDLKRNYNIHIEDEISEIVCENLKLQLTPDTIKEMLKEIKEKEKK